MCTMITRKAIVNGGGKGRDGWFPVTQVNIGYDHTSFLRNEHALLIDFVNLDLDPGARVAVELDVASGRALIAQIQAAIEAAEEAGVAE